MKRMIVDTANLLFRVAAAHGKYNQNGTAEERAGLSMHTALNVLNKYYKLYRPDQLAMTFEGGKNWRKDYTKSAECISKRVYKANRVKDPSMIPFFELIQSFEDLARNHTSLVCLSNPLLEGDDLFAGYVQRFSEAGDEIIGVSGDKDFVQLLKYPGFQLINPDSGKPRTLVDVCGVDDPLFFMFEKAMRGDKGDNVFPAYPRVLKKRLLKCMSDDYELTKIMNETWEFEDPDTHEKIIHKVGDLFNENMLLMNLDSQPDNVKQVIKETLDHELVNHGKYSHFHFTKFCGKYGLKQIAENSQAFAAMFSVTGQRSPHREETEAIAKKKSLVEF
jgi:5'-3' exonuclease, N-terminal resolvase-like domain